MQQLTTMKSRSMFSAYLAALALVGLAVMPATAHAGIFATAVGNNNTIVNTTDGGTTWSAQTSALGTGTALFGDTLFIYYGAADSYIACASLKLKALIDELLMNSTNEPEIVKAVGITKLHKSKSPSKKKKNEK